MNNTSHTFQAVRHAVYSLLPTTDSADSHEVDRDRGAVSIEQVLWYAAAAVSVAVVAAIIWNQIKTTAGTGVNVPSAP